MFFYFFYTAVLAIIFFNAILRAQVNYFVIPRKQLVFLDKQFIYLLIWWFFEITRENKTMYGPSLYVQYIRYIYVCVCVDQ